MERQQQLDAMPDTKTDGINLLDIVLLFSSRWKLIVVLTLTMALVGGLASRFRKTKYLATVSFSTQSEQQTTGILVLGRQTDPTLALLKSASVADYVVRDAHLETFNEGMPSRLSDSHLYFRSIVRSETKVTDSGDGLFIIEVKDPYPARAVAIANGFRTALQDLSFRMNAEGAAITRKFFEAQLQESRQSLASGEQRLRDAQARTGLLQPGSQTGQELGQISTLRSQLMSLQVQRATLAQSATAENPEMIRLAAQINETAARISALAAKTHNSDAEGIPTQNLELTRLERDVAEQQAVVTSLMSQFERAQLQERFTAPRVRTIDEAALPLPPASKQGFLLSLVGGALGFLIGVIIVIFRELRRRLMSSPEDAVRIRQIQQSLSWRNT